MATRHTLELAGGVRLAVTTSGAGPAIVLLHGFTGDASTMDLLAERLTPTHTVVVPDLIGHGASSGPASAHSVEAMAAQVIEMVAALGIEAPFDLVGYSMGGRVALTIACTHPQEVASLALIGASAGLADVAARAERAAADDALADALLDDGLEAFVDRWMANPLFATQARLGAEALAGFRAQRLGNRADGLAASLRAATTGRMRPLHDQLGHVHVPVQLVVGADDAKFQAIAGELSAGLSDGEVAVIADAGHAAHLEQPEAAVGAIRAGLTRARARTHPVDLPFVHPLTTGRGVTAQRSSVLVALRRDGLTGWGDASPLPGWSDENIDDVRMALVEPLVDFDSSTAWQSTTAWRDGEPVPAARAALAGAALDLDARRAGLRLADYLVEWHPALTAPALDGLGVNALIGDAEPGIVGEEAGRAVAAGFGTIKLKVGAGGPARDLERIAAMRAAAPSAVLRLDANGAWDHETAVHVLTAAERHEIALCEEPVAGLVAIASLAGQVGVPLAVDESVRTSEDFGAAVRHAGVIAAVVIKPQAIGGPDRAIEAIVAAGDAGLDVIVTSMLDNAVGRAHAAHVAAACRLEGAHGLHTGDLLTVDVAGGLPFEAGRIRLADAPGLGIGLVSPCGMASP